MTCDVEGCDRTARQWAGESHVCLMHKKRWMRNGHFDVVRFQSPPRPNRQLCMVEGCRKIDDGPHGYCKMHKTRMDRHGDPAVVIEPSMRDYPVGTRNHLFTGEDATYTAAHQRMRKAKGRARDHLCVDCGQQAAQWSYNHQDPDERIALDYHNAPYSLDFSYYEPRCVLCHKTFDLAWLSREAV